MSHGHRQRRGAHTLEYALILPAFSTMLLGTLEFGMYFYQNQTMITAVREGCVKAATYHFNDTGDRNPTTVAKNEVKSQLRGFLGKDCDDPGYSSNCSFNMTKAKDGDGVYRVRCEAKVKYPGYVLPLANLGAPNTVISGKHEQNLEIQY